MDKPMEQIRILHLTGVDKDSKICKTDGWECKYQGRTKKFYLDLAGKN
jgi:hypothetical protein